MEKHRAKTISPMPRWAFGYPVKNSNGLFIMVDDDIMLPVKEGTMGEQCPLKVNGKRLFEGDILCYTQHSGYLIPSCIMVVKFDTDIAAWGVKYKTDINTEPVFRAFAEVHELERDLLRHCKLIGNVIDNPDYIIELS